MDSIRIQTNDNRNPPDFKKMEAKLGSYVITVSKLVESSFPVIKKI